MGKHQRARMSSLQACCLAELKNSEPIRKLLALPQLQSPAVQPLLSYAIDSSFLMLARRDGSDGTGAVEATDLVQEVVAFFEGVCEGEGGAFEDCLGEARTKISRDGVEAGRDVPPPGSILNANITPFWLTTDLLDIDNSQSSGKILPALLQMLFHKGRLAIHGIRIEDYIKDFS